MTQSCTTHNNCSSCTHANKWNIITVIRLNNKVKADLTASRGVWHATEQGLCDIVLYAVMFGNLQQTLRRCQMPLIVMLCHKSWSVTVECVWTALVSLTIPEDIIPPQTLRSEGSFARTDSYIGLHQWFTVTGHFFMLTLATGHSDAPGLEANQQGLYRTLFNLLTMKKMYSITAPIIYKSNLKFHYNIYLSNLFLYNIYFICNFLKRYWYK